MIEHNLDVVKGADWVIDLGPFGGARGGRVLAVGTPEDVAEAPESLTGKFLKDVLGERVIAAPRKIATRTKVRAR